MDDGIFGFLSPVVLLLLFFLMAIICSDVSSNYYYVDIYGVEHKADYCGSSYGSFYCQDYETGIKFLVDSYRYEDLEENK